MNTVKTKFTEQDDGQIKMSIDLTTVPLAHFENGMLVTPLTSFPCLVEGTNLLIDWDNENQKFIFRER